MAGRSFSFSSPPSCPTYSSTCCSARSWTPAASAILTLSSADVSEWVLPILSSPSPSSSSSSSSSSWALVLLDVDAEVLERKEELFLSFPHLPQQVVVLASPQCFSGMIHKLFFFPLSLSLSLSPSPSSPPFFLSLKEKNSQPTLSLPTFFFRENAL